MIFGHLCNFEQEKAAFSPVLQKGLLYLKNTDLSKLAVGRHDIDGDNMFALVSEYKLEPKENRQPETHKKYIDIQCVAWGEEIIGCSILLDKYVIVKDELLEKDVAFYKTVEHEVDIVLKQGVYGIFFPSDVHRPGCISSSAESVKKIVIKIAVSLLKSKL